MKKSMLKKIVVALAFGALTTGSALAAVTGKVGHAMPESHPQAAAMNKFVELAAKYTAQDVADVGAFKIPAGEAGGPAEAGEGPEEAGETEEEARET